MIHPESMPHVLVTLSELKLSKLIVVNNLQPQNISYKLVYLFLKLYIILFYFLSCLLSTIWID